MVYFHIIWFLQLKKKRIFFFVEIADSTDHRFKITNRIIAFKMKNRRRRENRTRRRRGRGTLNSAEIGRMTSSFASSWSFVRLVATPFALREYEPGIYILFYALRGSPLSRCLPLRVQHRAFTHIPLRNSSYIFTPNEIEIKYNIYIYISIFILIYLSIILSFPK